MLSARELGVSTYMKWFIIRGLRGELVPKKNLRFTFEVSGYLALYEYVLDATGIDLKRKVGQYP